MDSKDVKDIIIKMSDANYPIFLTLSAIKITTIHSIITTIKYDKNAAKKGTSVKCYSCYPGKSRTK